MPPIPFIEHRRCPNAARSPIESRQQQPHQVWCRDSAAYKGCNGLLRRCFDQRAPFRFTVRRGWQQGSVGPLDVQIHMAMNVDGASREVKQRIAFVLVLILGLAQRHSALYRLAQRELTLPNGNRGIGDVWNYPFCHSWKTSHPPQDSEMIHHAPRID